MANAEMEVYIRLRPLNTMRVMLDKGAYEPIRAHENDAGLDLRTPYIVTVPAHGSVAIDTGVHVEIPRGWYGKLESKSGLNVKHDVVSCGGVIDSGFTGSIVAKLYNLSDKEYQFHAGDKVCQLLICPCATPKLEYVTEFAETERGDKGFGSSGK